MELIDLCQRIMCEEQHTRPQRVAAPALTKKFRTSLYQTQLILAYQNKTYASAGGTLEQYSDTFQALIQHSSDECEFALLKRAAIEHTLS